MFKMNHWRSENVFFYLEIILLFLLLQTMGSLCYYVGPEVGHAKGESNRVPRLIFGFPNGVPNGTTLAEAAYVPYVYSVGNNVVTFLRSIIPALQPKVDFFAEQIQDGIDIANNKLMQTLENSNNGIIAVENFFTGLMKAFVFGKGPDDDEEERRKRLADAAMAFIKSGMLGTTTPSSTTRKPTIATTTTQQSAITGQLMKRSTTGQPEKRTTTTTSKPLTGNDTVSSAIIASATTPSNAPVTDSTKPSKTKSPESSSANKSEDKEKLRDNNFNKMKVMEILKNMLM